jgi:hypothetical protein
MTLISVVDMSPQRPNYGPPLIVPPSVKFPAPPALDTFALGFSSSETSLPQGTYVVENASLGRLSLFIVPSGNSTYTAIISRFADAQPRLSAR